MPVGSTQKEDPNFSLKGVFQKGKEYVDTKFELLKLVVVAKVSRIIARLLLDVFRGILALLVLFFLSMALGFYLSDLLDNYALGFLATAGAFMLVIMLLSLFSVTIKRKIVDVSIRKIFDDLDEEEEEAKSDINDRVSEMREQGRATVEGASVTGDTTNATKNNGKSG